jgi:hypothetical protein
LAATLDTAKDAPWHPFSRSAVAVRVLAALAEGALPERLLPPRPLLDPAFGSAAADLANGDPRHCLQR